MEDELGLDGQQLRAIEVLVEEELIADNTRTIKPLVELLNQQDIKKEAIDFLVQANLLSLDSWNHLSISDDIYIAPIFR